MVRPYNGAQDADCPEVIHHHLVTEDWFAGKSGENDRYRPPNREQCNIHFRMSKEPQQVLEQQGVAAAGCNKEVGAEVPIRQQHGNRGAQYRDNQQQQKRSDQPRPYKQRHFHHLHAGRAQIENSDDHVDRAGDGRQAQQVYAKNGKVNPESCLD